MNFKKLNQINKLSQLPIPRVDQVLDVLGTARVFSVPLGFLVPPNKAHEDTAPLTAFSTPSGGSSCPRSAMLRLDGSSR